MGTISFSGRNLSYVVSVLVLTLGSHWNFSLTLFFRPHYGPGFDSASNRNEYQEYFLGG